MKNAVAIIIVSWNTRVLLGKCLDSIKKYTNLKGMTIWVVDNDSNDNSALMVKSEFPWVHLIHNKQNVGFGKANNQVLKKISSEYVLLLNPDTQFIDNSLNIMRGYLKQNLDVAACGPLLLNPDKSIQYLGFYRKYPSVIQTLLFYTDLYRITQHSRFLVKRFFESDLEQKIVVDVDQIPGAGFFARLSVLKEFGFFDEDYPLWFEDVDLCYRLKAAGYKLKFIPNARIIHVGGASFDQWKDRLGKETRFWKSLFVFSSKHFNILDRVAVKMIILLNLVFLISSRSFMQILRFKEDRQKFILLKLGLLKNLLTN